MINNLPHIELHTLCIYIILIIYVMIHNMYINTVKLPNLYVKIFYVLNSFVGMYIAIHNILKKCFNYFNLELNDNVGLVGPIQNLYNLFDIDNKYTHIIHTYMCTYCILFLLTLIYFYFKKNIKQIMLNEIKKQEMEGVTFVGNETYIKIKLCIYIYTHCNPVLIKFNSFTVLYMLCLIIRFSKLYFL